MQVDLTDCAVMQDAESVYVWVDVPRQQSVRCARNVQVCHLLQPIRPRLTRHSDRRHSLLQWTEAVEGIWYPRGGFHRVVDSLVRIAESHGATFHYSAPVSHVSVDEATGRARGIVLEGAGKDGGAREIEADLVVVNADLTYAHETLFRGKAGEKGTMREEKLAKKLKGKPHSCVGQGWQRRMAALIGFDSCSSISFYWAMDRKIKGLEAHNIFLVRHCTGGRVVNPADSTSPV